MSDLSPHDSLPANESEVIQRLKIKPKSVIAEMSQRQGEDPRFWVKLTYEFKDKLAKLGKFLYDIAKDVEQAGGYVTQFSISDMIGLSPRNENLDDKSPHKDWACSYIKASIRTQKKVHEDAAAWDEAIRSIFKRNQS